jgi:hypothetical protein
MWVRTQDLKELINLDMHAKVRVDKDFYSLNGYGLYTYNNYEDRYCLGIYNTEEKAIHVLNEIQNQMKLNEVNKVGLAKLLDKAITNPEFLRSEIERLNFTYVMPADDPLDREET